MVRVAPPLRFSHHALAVLGAAMIGATALAVYVFVAVLVTPSDRMTNIGALLGIVSLVWLGVFLIAFPAAGLLLSLLWPITRRVTAASGLICAAAGAATGALLAPLSSRGMMGAGVGQLACFMLTGVLVGAAYMAFARRLRRDVVAGAWSFRRGGLKRRCVRRRRFPAALPRPPYSRG